MKKKELLMVKELAAELRMSLKSIQRAYREEEIRVEWLCRMARFDLAQVRRAMKRNAQACVVSTVTRPCRARPAAQVMDLPPVI